MFATHEVSKHREWVSLEADPLLVGKPSYGPTLNHLVATALTPGPRWAVWAALVASSTSLLSLSTGHLINFYQRPTSAIENSGARRSPLAKAPSRPASSNARILSVAQMLYRCASNCGWAKPLILLPISLGLQPRPSPAKSATSTTSSLRYSRRQQKAAIPEICKPHLGGRSSSFSPFATILARLTPKGSKVVDPFTTILATFALVRTPNTGRSV